MIPRPPRLRVFRFGFTYLHFYLFGEMCTQEIYRFSAYIWVEFSQRIAVVRFPVCYSVAHFTSSTLLHIRHHFSHTAPTAWFHIRPHRHLWWQYSAGGGSGKGSLSVGMMNTTLFTCPYQVH